MLALPAAAHMKIAVGSLVDLVERSDVVVIATVKACEGKGAPFTLTLAPSSVVVGKLAAAEDGGGEAGTIQVSSEGRFENGSRGVFFLARSGDRYRCLQKPGAVYDSSPKTDNGYQTVITGIRQALSVTDEGARISTLRVVLASSLGAPAQVLRYHAALDLLATVHPDHPLTNVELDFLRKTVSQPEFDPEVRALLERAALSTAPPPPTTGK